MKLLEIGGKGRKTYCVLTGILGVIIIIIIYELGVWMCGNAEGKDDSCKAGSCSVNYARQPNQAGKQPAARRACKWQN